MSTINTIPISDFPDIKNILGEGLVKVDPSIANPRILAFLNKSSDQPSFFISRESWQLLIEGKTLINPLMHFQEKKVVRWLPDNYEIYAFVFCIATFESEPINPAISHISTPYDGLNYFRIRTIIRNVENKDSNNLVEVETGNIAYVSLTTALANIQNPIKEDCLRFFAPENVTRGDLFEASALRKLKKDIDFGVETWKTQQEKHTSRIKIVKIENNEEKIIPIEQEGCVFSKSRIESVFNDYENSPGSDIFFELNTDENTVGYVFKINSTFMTQYINCPPPIPLCKNKIL